MKTGTQITFTSDFFTPIAGEEAHTNPGVYGQAWANWFADRLRERGVSVEGVIPEQNCRCSSASSTASTPRLRSNN